MQRDSQYLPYGDELLRLGVITDPEGQVDPTVRLAWQPTQVAVQKLAEAEATDAHLLVIVEINGKEKGRHMLPLSWGQGFIALTNPGRSAVHATIVWSDDPKDRSAKRFLMRQFGSGRYNIETLTQVRPRLDAIAAQISQLEDQIEYDDEGEEIENPTLFQQISDLLEERNKVWQEEEFESIIHPHLFADGRSRVGHQLGYAKLEVNVPKEMFATSWRITSWLGYLFTERPARDNCHLRRRAIISAMVAPVIFPVMLLLVTLYWLIWHLTALGAAVVLTVAGYRNLLYSPLVRFMPEDMNDMWATRQPSRWFTSQVKEMTESDYRITYPLRHPAIIVINPPVVICLALIVGVLHMVGIPWSTVVVWSVSATISVLLMVLVSAWYNAKTEEREQSAMEARKDRSRTKHEIIQRYTYSAQEVLKSPRMPAIQLIRLKAKAKVCKPFAQSR